MGICVISRTKNTDTTPPESDTAKEPKGGERRDSDKSAE